MIDVTDTPGFIQRLSSIDLSELRALHARIVGAEEITRALIRRREAQARREARIRERGLSVTSDG